MTHPFTEQGIIDVLKAQFPTHIGDDAAILALSPTERFVITQDLLVEDVHFRLRYHDAESLAHKALHVNLSDIAAMGATPKYILLGLSIPNANTGFLRDFLKHFSINCHTERVTLIGGDTTRSEHGWFISVTAIGTVLPHQIKHRHQAQTGDMIYLAGHLGDAHLGLTALEKDVDGFDDMKAHFLRPQALIHEGIWLGAQSEVTAMMDSSDGLFTDLKKLTDASGLGAIISLNTLIPTPTFLEACQTLSLDPLQTQLTGGEDYSLLFTVQPSNASRIEQTFMAQFGYALQSVGTITTEKGVRLIQNGHPVQRQLTPFAHF